MVVGTDLSTKPRINAAVTEVLHELSPSVRNIR